MKMRQYYKRASLSSKYWPTSLHTGQRLILPSWSTDVSYLFRTVVCFTTVIPGQQEYMTRDFLQLRSTKGNLTFTDEITV
jgi:hypothetical protein